MACMRAFLALCVLGIGVTGVNAATIQSPAPAGAPVLSDAGQNGDSAAGTTVTTPSQDAGTASTSPTGLPPSSTTLSDDPINWPKGAPVAVSKGGSGKGYGTRTGGRRAGGGGGHSKGGGG